MAINTWNILTCEHCGKLVKLPKDIGDARALCPGCKNPLPAATLAQVLEAGQQSPAFLTPAEVPEVDKVPEPIYRPALGVNEVPSSIILPSFRSFNPDSPRLRTNHESWQRKAPELREVDFKDRLARTTDAEMVQGPNDPPPLKRKRISRSELRHRNLNWDESEERQRTSTKRAWLRTLRKVPWGLIGLLILSLAGVTWKIMKLRRTQHLGAGIVEITPVAASEKAKPSELELRPKSLVLPEILPVLQTFLHAKSSVELRPLIREPERVQPLMDLYYQEQAKFQPVDYHALPRFEDLFVHKNYIVASLENHQFEPFTISLEKTDQGYLVDWESFVAYGEMSFDQFQKTKPTTPTLFRFIVEPTSYPNMDFPSSTTHQAYKLYTKNRDRMLYGYTPQQSGVHQKLMFALLEKKSVYCVVRIKYSDNSTNDQQVEITHYLQTGWVMRGEDFLTPTEESPGRGVLGE